MPNYLQRLIERASGDGSASAKSALVPHAVPRREGGDDDPLEASVVEAAPAAGARRVRSETVLVPVAPRVDVRESFTARPHAVAMSVPPRLEPGTFAPSTPRAEPEPQVVPIAPRSDAPARFAPPSPRREEQSEHAEAHPTSSPQRLGALKAPVAPSPLLVPAASAPDPASAVPPVRLTPPIPEPAPAPRPARLEPTAPPPVAPEPPRAPSVLEPQVLPERPPLPPAPPILSIGKIIVEVMPAPAAKAPSAPVIVRRAAPVATGAPSSILHRGFGLGQS